jgi:hypothetical protein
LRTGFGDQRTSPTVPNRQKLKNPRKHFYFGGLNLVC